MNTHWRTATAVSAYITIKKQMLANWISVVALRKSELPWLGLGVALRRG